MILACQTLQREVSWAIKETKAEYPVIYIESGLHNDPAALRRAVQRQLDMLDNVEVVLLVFGYCGKGLAGVGSPRFKIVVPRVDDCISILLGSMARRKELSREMGTYFFTQGWLEYEKNIIWEYERCVCRYGENRAMRLMKRMLEHYDRFVVIDTGAYSLEGIMPKTKAFADKLDMYHEVVKGSPRLINKLLTGEWDEEFFILEPGREITLENMCAGSCDPGGSQLLSGR